MLDQATKPAVVVTQGQELAPAFDPETLQKLLFYFGDALAEWILNNAPEDIRQIYLTTSVIECHLQETLLGKDVTDTQASLHQELVPGLNALARLGGL